MTSFKTAAFVASALTTAIATSAGAQGLEKMTPNGDYVPSATPAPSVSVVPPKGQPTTDGEFGKTT